MKYIKILIYASLSILLVLGIYLRSLEMVASAAFAAFIFTGIFAVGRIYCAEEEPQVKFPNGACSSVTWDGKKFKYEPLKTSSYW
jgi:hypothetical protein